MIISWWFHSSSLFPCNIMIYWTRKAEWKFNAMFSLWWKTCHSHLKLKKLFGKMLHAAIWWINNDWLHTVSDRSSNSPDGWMKTDLVFLSLSLPYFQILCWFRAFCPLNHITCGWDKWSKYHKKTCRNPGMRWRGTLTITVLCVKPELSWILIDLKSEFAFYFDLLQL